MSTIGGDPTPRPTADLNDIATVLEIKARHGWTEDDLLAVYERFVTERELLHDFAQYCMGIDAFVQTYTPKENR